jgi:hypothetical protein
VVEKTVCDPLPVNVNCSRAKLGAEFVPAMVTQSVPAAFGKLSVRSAVLMRRTPEGMPVSGGRPVVVFRSCRMKLDILG